MNAVLAGFDMKLPGPVVRVDTSARAQWPDHPFIHAQDKFAKKFGTSSLAAIGVVVRDGNIFTPDTLKKLHEITRRLDGVGYDSHVEERDALRDKLSESGMSDEEVLKELDRRYPPYPVNHDQVRSLAHSSTRAIQIEPDGSITSDVLMKKVPETQEEADKLREVVLQNPPFIYGRLVSWDEQGALVSAGFITDRLSNSQIYTAVFNHVQAIKTEFEDPACAAATQRRLRGGRLGRRASASSSRRRRRRPGRRAATSRSSSPASRSTSAGSSSTPSRSGSTSCSRCSVIFALLLAYFRRLHGVLIPFVAAVITVIWGTGFTGWTGITFDPLVLVIPMIITARAVSHTVQMAERFFEDFEVLAPRYADPNEAKIEAATIAMAELIVPGTLGIVVDVGGLLVILVTSIPQMRDLAIFGAFWVTSILCDGGDPAPGHDLLPARAQGARALPAEGHGARDALRRLDHHASELEVRGGRDDDRDLHPLDLHHAHVLEDRRR